LTSIFTIFSVYKTISYRNFSDIISALGIFIYGKAFPTLASQLTRAVKEETTSGRIVLRTDLPPETWTSQIQRFRIKRNPRWPSSHQFGPRPY